MASDRIVIQIVDDASEQVNVDGQNKKVEPELNQKSKVSLKQVAIIGSMASVGKQVISYGLNNYGNFTGDYVAQQKINDASKMIGQVSMIGAGFAVGGVAGGAAATVAVGVNAMLSELTRMNNEKKSNVQAEQLRILTGTYVESGGRT